MQRKRRVCTHDGATTSAMDLVLQHWVQLACEYIDIGSPGGVAVDSYHRSIICSALNKAPLLCLQLRATCSQDLRFGPIIFYERVRLGSSSSGNFLESVPATLSLFNAASNVVLNEDDVKRLTLRDTVVNRQKTIASLENMSNGSAQLLSLVEDYRAEDLSHNLPGRVHVFVSRMRAVCSGLERVKPASHFGACRNKSCVRKFYRGAPKEAWAQRVCPESDSSSTIAFWDLAAGEPERASSQGEFCTYACCAEWRAQLRNALPHVDEKALVADVGIRYYGRSRVSAALRLCMKRNEACARHMRLIQKERKTFPAVCPLDLASKRMRCARLLNVDVGLLIAASVCAESSTLSHGKVLAGATEGWRSRLLFHAKALKHVSTIYERFSRKNSQTIISNLLIDDSFVQRVRSQAAQIFK